MSIFWSPIVGVMSCAQLGTKKCLVCDVRMHTCIVRNSAQLQISLSAQTKEMGESEHSLLLPAAVLVFNIF